MGKMDGLGPYHVAGLFLFGHFLSYPFTTVQKRLQCQMDRVGMIPQRYSGVIHGLNLIRAEEGFKGLYRGYFAMLTYVSSLLTETSLMTLFHVAWANSIVIRD